MENIALLRDRLVEIAKAIDLYALQQFTEHNSFMLAVDEDTVFYVNLDEGRGVVSLTAGIGIPPASNMSRAYRLALAYSSQIQANGGCHIGLDAESGEMSIYCDYALASLDTDRLGHLIINFVNKIRGWRKIVAEPDVKDEELLMGIGADNFIRL